MRRDARRPLSACPGRTGIEEPAGRGDPAAGPHCLTRPGPARPARPARPGPARLTRPGLGLSDIDFFEVDEAFASVVLAWAKEVGADLDRVDVRGGAIALGHPLGASGARLITSLRGTLEEHDARYGLQLMCEGGGMANATLIERVAG